MVSEKDLNAPEESRVSSDSPVPMANTADERTADSASDIWQKRLLPFMICVLAVLTSIFFISSFYQYYQLQKRTEDTSLLESKEGDSQIRVDGVVDSQTQIELAKWQTLLAMERSAIKRRYHQANVLLMARIWIKYLGFITGMTLALVGATFILGKLRESEAKLAADSTWWKFSMTTASPGLLLALLGTVLMVTTLIAPYEIQVADSPLYISGSAPIHVPTDSKQLSDPEKLETQSEEQLIKDAAEILRRKEKPQPSPSQ